MKPQDIKAIRNYVAYASVGASTVRGLRTKGAVKAARVALQRVDLGPYGKATKEEFAKLLNKDTKRVQRSLPKGARYWMRYSGEDVNSIREFDKRPANYSINTRVQHSEHFIQQGTRSFANTFRMAGTEIDGLHLIHHDEARNCDAISDRDMEGILAIRVGNGAGDCHSRVTIEQVVAHNEGRSTPFLFMSGLRVKG